MNVPKGAICIMHSLIHLMYYIVNRCPYIP